MNSQPWAWPRLQHQSLNSLCGVGRKSSQKALSSLSHRHVTVAAFRASCSAGWYSSKQGQALNKIIGVFSPPAVCTVPSDTLKVSHQGRNFPFWFEIDFYVLQPKFWYFQWQALIMQLWWAAKSSADSLRYFGDFWILLDQQLVGREPMPGPAVFIYPMSSRMALPTPCDVSLLRLLPHPHNYMLKLAF